MTEHEAYRILGEPTPGGIIVVSDHASNRVPDDIDLGVPPALLELHIAIDIGVAEVGSIMARQPGFCAFQGNVSRLVCDFNREEHQPATIPIASDGHAIPGNAIDHPGHEARLERLYRPYHAALEELLEEAPPALILSLHSFTPQLQTSNELRPWQCGVLYNLDERAARLALPMFEAERLVVGDQQPYSGRLLNTTMNRHAETHGFPYFGIEIRQDQISDPAGHAQWAKRLCRICNDVALKLDN